MDKKKKYISPEVSKFELSKNEPILAAGCKKSSSGGPVKTTPSPACINPGCAAQSAS